MKPKKYLMYLSMVSLFKEDAILALTNLLQAYGSPVPHELLVPIRHRPRSVDSATGRPTARDSTRHGNAYSSEHSALERTSRTHPTTIFPVQQLFLLDG